MGVSFAARTLVIAALTGGLAMWPSSARGDDRVHASLTYAPDADIERCPTATELEDAVAARVGYDPFDGSTTGADAPRREVVVAVHRRAGGIVGVLELRGPRPGIRELASPSGDCRELLDALAVAIAIGIDPASLTRPPGELPAPAPVPAPAPGPAPAPIAAASSPDRVSAPPKEPVDVRVGAGPVVLFGELPATAAGIELGIGARWKWLEPAVGGIATLPVSLSTPQGQVTASLIAAALVPCGHADVVFVCVGLTLGALRGEGDAVASPRRGSQLYSAASARAGAEVALSRTVWLRGYAEAVAPVTRIALQLAAQDVWRVPSVAARVGVAAGIRF
jgi:hypothetical protein